MTLMHLEAMRSSKRFLHDYSSKAVSNEDKPPWGIEPAFCLQADEEVISDIINSCFTYRSFKSMPDVGIISVGENPRIRQSDRYQILRPVYCLMDFISLEGA